jgi:hypothetical protein
MAATGRTIESSTVWSTDKLSTYHIEYVLYLVGLAANQWILIMYLMLWNLRQGGDIINVLTPPSYMDRAIARLSSI